MSGTTITPDLLKELPEELREQLKIGRRSGPNASSLVLDVIPPDNPVDANEILIAVWRKHQVILKRATMMAAVTNLRREGKVRRCGRGSFTLGYEEMAPVQPRPKAVKKKVAKKAA